MSRAAKKIISLLSLLFFIVIAGINFNPIATIFAIVGTCAMLFYFIWSTDGLYTGYLETLNSDVTVAKKNIASLISSSNESVKIISATLSPAIYCQPDVFYEIEEAKKRGVKFEIILSGNVKAPGDKIRPSKNESLENFNKLWSWVRNGEIEVYCFRGDPWPHIMIVDNLHVRIEDKHRIVLYPDARLQKRRAKTHLLDLVKAQKYSEKFIKFKENSTPYIFSQTH